MLKKLFKYDFRGVTRLLLLIHGILLALIIMARLTLQFFLGTPLEGAATAISLAFGILLISGVAIFSYVYPGFFFYQKVFSNEGYLTNTLPVTPTQIVISKSLCNLIWMIIDIIVVIGSFMILLSSSDLPNQLADFWEIFTGLFDYPTVTLFIVVTILVIIIGLPEQIYMMYLSIALGNQLFPGHKAIGSVGVYFGIYTVMQMVGSGIIFVFGRGYLHLIQNSTDLGNSTTDMVHIFNTLNPMMIASLLFTTVCAILFYFFTIKVMDKHLNMQ